MLHNLSALLKWSDEPFFPRVSQPLLKIHAIMLAQDWLLKFVFSTSKLEHSNFPRLSDEIRLGVISDDRRIGVVTLARKVWERKCHGKALLWVNNFIFHSTNCNSLQVCIFGSRAYSQSMGRCNEQKFNFYAWWCTFIYRHNSYIQIWSDLLAHPTLPL